MKILVFTTYIKQGMKEIKCAFSKTDEKGHKKYFEKLYNIYVLKGMNKT